MHTGIAQLCEFIEDCEFPALLIQVLHIIGLFAPHTASPSKYIKYIYNRIILESHSVRAAAITALAKYVSCD
jgi:coatomer protein complex subunit gamma